MNQIPFHVGFVVASIDESMLVLSQALGSTWTTPAHREFDIRTPDGLIRTPDGLVRQSMKYVYSRSTPLSIELIEAGGHPWEVGIPTSRHLGYWSQDLDSDSHRLIDKGYRFFASDTQHDGNAAKFVYLQAPDDTLVELVSTNLRDGFEAWIAGTNPLSLVR